MRSGTRYGRPARRTPAARSTPAFTDEEEDQSKPGKIGLPWYVETALKNRGAIFDDGDAACVSHVVIDRNLITAQNPGSTDAAAYAMLKRLGSEPLSARNLAEEFFARMEAGEVDEILGMMTPEATVSLVPLDRHGPVAADGASYLRELSGSFPDLLVRVRRLFVTGDNTAVAEITIDGTQAGDFLAVVNQEKHLDLDQAWMLRVTPDDRISAVTAYWDQNQLYRRLGVKRLDKVTITVR